MSMLGDDFHNVQDKLMEAELMAINWLHVIGYPATLGIGFALGLFATKLF